MTSYEKPDFWSLKAQKEDYPARSVYKLKEIDEKFSFFKPAPALRVLDLGAAPGSWSLYVLRRCGKFSGKNLFLAAVDLLPLSRHFDRLDPQEFLFIQGDFTAGSEREKLLSHGPYNAIISDAAPPTTGSKMVDTQRSLVLAEEALSFAENCLAPGGNLTVKVFQGGDSAALLKRFRDHFTGAKSYKPAACRSSSFETYFIGLGKMN